MGANYLVAAATLVGALMIAPAGAVGSPPEGVTGAVAPAVLDGGISVAVTADQRVTLLGEATSARAVILEVCRQAGVELRGYAGPEYRYIGKLENVPLADAFRSVLREESYALGLRAGGDSSPPRVVWIRLLGGDPGGVVPMQATVPVQTVAATEPALAADAAPSPPSASAPATPSAPFLLPPKLLFEAFNTFRPEALDTAQREVLARIAGKPEARAHFLATNATDLANLFRPYRDAAGTVKRLQGLAVDRDVQVKFGEVVRALEGPR